MHDVSNPLADLDLQRSSLGLHLDSERPTVARSFYSSSTHPPPAPSDTAKGEPQEDHEAPFHHAFGVPPQQTTILETLEQDEFAEDI